ncbi:MAG: ABC transporter permease [Bacilli bacterium]|nr:ABC transporter permease [Bacilli bacterium]
MGLLFLNALKGLKKKKVQMIGIIFMVLLSTGIYTTMNSALDRMENRYYNYLESQNVEHFSFTPQINFQKDITLENIKNWSEGPLKDVNSEEKHIIGLYQTCLQTDFTPCQNTGVQYLLENILNKYSVLDEIATQKLSTITKPYDFFYEKEKSKIATFDKYTYKMMPYVASKKINQAYLVKGSFPKKEDEITVLPNFAKINHLSIGDTYKIEGKSYKIVGTAMAPAYIYPLLSMNNPIFDEKYNVICYMYEKNYETFEGIEESVYVAKFNHEVNRNDTLKVVVSEEGKAVKSKNPATPLFLKEQDIIKSDMNTMIRAVRTSAIQMEFDTDRKFAEYFLYLLLGISVFIIAIITKKRIEDEKLQIGVLKSLGYKAHKIAFSYLVYPIIGSLIGGTLGFLIGSILHEPLAHLYVSYFNVPLTGFQINLQYLITSVFLPLVTLSLLSYIISIYMLRKKPLELLKEGSHLKVNLLSKITNFLTKKLSFESRFRYSLASRSLGKLLIVSLTSFCTGLLIVLILVGMNLFNGMIDQTFDSLTYKYKVSYKTAETATSEEDDLVLNTSATLLKVKKEHEIEKIKEDTNVTVNGVDRDLKHIELISTEGKNISHLLDDDTGIIINQNIAEVYHVNVGDILFLKVGDKELEYPVMGISNAYMGSTIYINRESFNETIGLEEKAYNERYSINQKYASMKKVSKEELSSISNIFSVDDLRRNMEKQMQTANSSIYIVIAFASVMAFIIIAVIANIVVEENKKTISLMKVLGYKNKEISKVVLNIYTPFVIIAYLLSIPCMISLLKWIVSFLVGDMNLAIPISLSPYMAGLGLLGLVVAYYLAIFISRRVLNQVPLAVALKRE